MLGRVDLEIGNKRGYYWAIIQLFILIGHGVTGSTASESVASDHGEVHKTKNDGFREPAAVWRCYWKNGLQIDSPRKNFTIRFNSGMFIDGGYTGVDDELGEAFPNLKRTQPHRRFELVPQYKNPIYVQLYPGFG